MVLKFYNTLTRRKAAFKPARRNLVRMYSCGPTVYDYAHIGNFRAYVFSDLVRRYLEHSGYRVKLVMNITDVDDKTIRGARESGVTLGDYTRKYTEAFFEDLAKLGIKKASAYPTATGHIPEMLRLISKLSAKGYAYKSSDGCVYFDISRFKGYGRLSKLRKSGLKAGARVSQDQYDKKDARDFALWKAWSEDDGGVSWDSPFGKGRPGWHIECSAMSAKYLGQPFDIHTGGVDLIFPHHENEIAQSEAAAGKPLAGWFLHNEHLLVEGKKMSKSLGNFHTLRDILARGYAPRAVRLLLLSTHYRQKLDFTFAGLDAAKGSLGRLADFMDMLDGVTAPGSHAEMGQRIAAAREAFGKAMDDDLNVPGALAALFGFVRDANRAAEGGKLGKGDAAAAVKLMNGFDLVLGILGERRKGISGQVEMLIREREEARKARDFARADEIREKLAGMGVVLEDGSGGVKWKLRDRP